MTSSSDRNSDHNAQCNEKNPTSRNISTSLSGAEMAIVVLFCPNEDHEDQETSAYHETIRNEEVILEVRR